MKNKSISGQVEWDDEGIALRFLKPFAQMLFYLKSNKHIDRVNFIHTYSLTNSEFNDLVGYAEQTLTTLI